MQRFRAVHSIRDALGATTIAAALCALGCGDGTGPAGSSPGEGFVMLKNAGAGGVEIFSMRTDGTGLRQLTDTDGENFLPEWSPDARRIAFVSTRDTVPGERRVGQVYVMNADGTNQKRLTDRSAGYVDGSLDWSPDGKQIVYVCRELNDFQEQLCVMGADGAGRRRLLPAGWRGIDPAWSPDGRTIAFSGTEPNGGYLHLWGVPPEGGTPRQISVELNTLHEEEPQWSPDGTRLLFRSLRPRPPFGPGLFEVFVMRVDGSDRRPLIADMAPLSTSHSARWSADGTRIAFLRDYGAEEGFYFVSSDGSGAQRLMTEAYPFGRFSWTGR